MVSKAIPDCLAQAALVGAANDVFQVLPVELQDIRWLVEQTFMTQTTADAPTGA